MKSEQSLSEYLAAQVKRYHRNLPADLFCAARSALPDTIDPAGVLIEPPHGLRVTMASELYISIRRILSRCPGSHAGRVSGDRYLFSTPYTEHIA